VVKSGWQDLIEGDYAKKEPCNCLFFIAFVAWAGEIAQADEAKQKLSRTRNGINDS